MPRSKMSRRDFARASASAAAAFGLTGARLGAQTGRQGGPTAPTPAPPPSALKSEFLRDMILETGGPGGGAVGTRQIVPVIGGTFEGPKLRGKVLPPGADWLVRISDTVRVLDVRTLLLTDDDQRIYVTYRGVLHTPPGQERYQRVGMMFETGSEKYAWLHQIIAVGVGYTIPQRVPYRIFQIL
jgi:Protein of unknown function (DUF3237)